MTHKPPSNDVIFQVDILEEMNETGCGIDLDNNCFDLCNIDDSMRGVKNSRSRYILVVEYSIDQVGMRR